VTRRSSRRQFLRTAALGAAGLALNSRLRAQSAKLPSKPNLLVFLPDQLRADTIVGANASIVHAPNLHKLASQAVVFERTYVTHPICAPSRSSLLSGTWPHQNGCTNNRGVLPRKFLCLPEMLGDSSYTSGYFGKWHLGDEFVPQHGFSEWASILESFKRVEREHHAQRWLDQLISKFEPSRGLDHERVTERASDYTKFLVSKAYQPDAHKAKYFSSEFVSTLPFEFSRAKFIETRVCEFLERHGRGPFVLFVAFFEPHPPYNGPFNGEHSFENIQLDASAGDTLGKEIPLRSRLLQEAYRNELRGPDGFRHTKQNYFGLITEIDRCVGTILAKLTEIGVADRTITVLTSDHGDMMSAHGLLGKQLMYEQSAAVPYLIRAPGVSPRHFSQPVSHIDFVPTMLDLLGKPPHSQCAGQSRAGLVYGESAPADFVFLEWAPEKPGIALGNSALAGDEELKNCLHESTRAVASSDGWKLCLRDKDKNELYNLHDDPDERHNLYYGADQRAVIGRLTEEIHRWQQRTGDRLKV
jgi:arylsulfatase A-like enzyme